MTGKLLRNSSNDHHGMRENIRWFINLILVLSVMLLLRAEFVVSSPSTKHAVTALPLLDDNGNSLPISYTGYLSLSDEPTLVGTVLSKKEYNSASTTRIDDVRVNNRKNANLFYWYWPHQPQNSNRLQEKQVVPLLIYINGGPGCSSLSSLFFESGPFILKPSTGKEKAFDLKMRLSEEQTSHTWSTLSHVLYLDAPVGTGYSYTDTKKESKIPSDGVPTNSKLLAIDLRDALVEFFKLYPELKQAPIYLFGNGYSAKSISYLTLLSQSGNTFNISGILMEDALLKPSVQYASYPRYGYMRGIVSYGQMVRMNGVYGACMSDVQNGDSEKTSSRSCQPLFDTMITNAGVSPLDSRILQQDFPNENVLADYLNRTDVMSALGVNRVQQRTRQFDTCRTAVHDAMKHEIHVDLPDSLLPTIIDDYSVPVLVYNDQFNIKSNVLGMQEVLRTMKWKGREWFNSLLLNPFTRVEEPEEYEGNIHGQFKSYGGLTHMIAFNGIHRGLASLDKIDQINTRYEVIKRFTGNGQILSTNALCDSIDDHECTVILDCPNQCSGHGQCVIGKNRAPTCNCTAGYSGADCSLYDSSHVLISKGTSDVQSIQFSASLTGREAAVYRLKFHPTVNLMDIECSLTQLSDTGNPVLMLNVSSSEHVPDADFMKHIASSQVENNVLNGFTSWKDDTNDFEDRVSKLHLTQQGSFYPYFNMSHTPTKMLKINGVLLYSSTDNILSIAVYNNEDAPCTYRISLQTKPGSNDIQLFYLFLGLSFLMFLVVLAEIVIIVTKRNQRLQAEMTINNRSQDRVPLIR